MQFRIEDILPNPFRRIDRYPIRPEKVAALRESLQRTGFWDNVVGRKRGDKVEIAYGHHRWRALQEEYPPEHRVGIVVRDLSDEDMLAIMVRENQEEWGTSFLVEMETVAAVVKAYAEDKIRLEQVPLTNTDTRIRYAPSFIAGKDVADARPQHPYTGQTIGRFLGWLEPSGKATDTVYAVLQSLAFIEEGLLQEQDFVNLSNTQARVVVEQAYSRKLDRERSAKAAERLAKEAREEAQRLTDETQRQAALRREAHQRKQAEEHRAKGKAEATKVAKAVSEELLNGAGTRQARAIANSVVERRPRPTRSIDSAINSLASGLAGMLATDRTSEKLEELIHFGDQVSYGHRRIVARELKNLAERATKFANTLLSEKIAQSKPATSNNQKLTNVTK